MSDKPKQGANVARKFRPHTHLSKQREDMMRMFYGSGISLPIETSGKPIPSPQESIERAGQYVMKMQEKGFCKIEPGVTSPSDIYVDPWGGRSQRTSQRTTSRVTSRMTARAVKPQPYQEFWLNTEAVKRVISELRDMKFRNEVEKENAVVRFNERIMKVTSIMKDGGMLETKNRSKQDLQSSMNWFIQKVREERAQLIRSCLAFNKLNWTGLSRDQQNEFRECAPKRSASQQPQKPAPESDAFTEIENATMMKYLDSVIMLPKGYHFGSSLLTDRASSAASFFTKNEMQEVARRVREQINRPRSSSKREVIVEPQLTVNAPPKRRSNAMIILNKRPSAGAPQKSTRPIPILSKAPSVVETPVPEELPPVVEEPTPEPEPPVEQTDEKPQEPVETANEPAEQPKEEPEPLPQSEVAKVLAKDMNPQYVLQNRNPGDFAFLNEQTDEIVATGEGKLMHERLKKVWDQLGFSVQQKLEMAVKYTNISDDYGRFVNAVQKWEDAFQILEDYDKAYKDLKEFLRDSARTDKAHAFRQLKSAFETADTAVRETAALMKAQYNDELVMRRKQATDLCDARKYKLEILMKQQGYATK